MGIIRLLLAIAVFNSHFSMLDWPLVDGHEAVLAFFAISGFYMALLLDTSYKTTGNFYMGRFLTLYPMYVFALGLSLAVLTTLDIHPMTTCANLRTLLSDPVSFLVMAWTSTCLFGQELLFSLAQSPHGGLHFVGTSRTAIWIDAPLIQAWSLSLELVFYALAPYLVRLKTPVILGLVAASLALKLAVMAGPLADIVFFKRFFPIEFWLFGAGILAYRVHRLLPERRRPLDYVLFAVLAGLMLVGNGVPENLQPFFIPGATIVALPLVFRGFKRLESDRLVGKISYPFYLLHYTIIAIFETYTDEPEGWHILLAGLVAATVAHFLFNSGIEPLKTRLRRHSAQPAIVGGAAFLPAAPSLVQPREARFP